jgi:alpha-L-rhamnosidase
LALVLTLVWLVTLLPAGLITGAAASAVTVQVTDLQTEYETNPLGLDEAHPRLSWALASDARGVKQQRYQITVTKGASDGPVVWAADEVSDNTLNIPYGGAALEPATRYYWRVTAQTNAGTAVSEPAWFETGFMNPKIDAWNGALWLTKPMVSENPDVADYTVEYDFRMIKDGGGLIFAATGNNYLMWQFNINPVERPYGGTPYFRPHRWNPGGASLAEIKIDHVIPDSEEGKHAWYRCRIVVRAGQSGTVITTSVGPVGGMLTVIDNARTVAGSWELGKIGFRQIHDNNNEEITEYDNIAIWDDTDDDSRLLYAETFDSAPTGMFGTRGTTQDGVYRVGGETFTSSRNVVDPAPPEGGEPLFRKEFIVDKPVRSARLYATARGYYEFSLNGEKVGDVYLAPGWTDYYYTIMYQTYDVTGMLRSGGNAIGGMLGMGWYSGPHQLYGYNMYGNTQSLLGKLVITYEDGMVQTVVTDGSWQYHPGPILYAENYAGETYDARYDCAGWNTAGYDAAGWIPAGIHTPLPAAVDIVPQTGPPVREVERFEQPVLTEPVPGQYTYDFGQNIAGFVTVKVKGAAGTRITIRHGEMLNTTTAYKNPGEAAVNNGDGPVGTVYRANLRDQQVPVAFDYYILKGDPAGETYTPRFTFHGFRYIEITGVDEAIPPEDVTAIAISSDNALTSAFETSNPKVNQLYSNVVWGMRGNFVSIPTDCPNRDERLGYTGDTQIFAGTGVYLANADQFYAKWLRDLRSYQMNEETTGEHKGLVPVLIPAVRTSGFTQWSNAWGDGAVIVPWQMYQQYGDEQIIRDSFDSMKAWCDFLNAPERSADYIRNRYTGRDNNYGDWLAVESSPQNMTNTLFSAYSNKLFAKMARVIGETEVADQYDAVTQNIVNAFTATFRNADGTLKATSQTPYAMLIYFGLADEADSTFLAETLMENVRTHGWKLTSGFIGVSYLTPALSQNGQSEAAFRLLEQEDYPSWIYSINQGATTTWERWNSYTVANGFGSVGMNSFNHYAFGSIGEWMMSGVLGIRRDEAAPGFRHFVLDPQYGGTLTYARGHYDSVSGRIESAWTWDQDTGDFTYNFTVPANTGATVSVPTRDPSLVLEGAQAAAEAEGVTYLGYDAASQRALYEVASGSYAFMSDVAVIGERRDLTVQSGTPDAIAEVTAHLASGDTRPQKTPALVTVGSKETFSLSVRPYNDVDFAFEAWEDGLVDNPRTFEGLAGDGTLTARFRWIGAENLLTGATVTAQASHTSELNGSWGRDNLIDGLLTARSGRNGWTSAIVGENPTGSNIPIVTFDMGAPKPFNRLHLYPRSDALTLEGKMAGFPRDFRLEGSQNGSDWTVIRSETDVEAPYLAPYVLTFAPQTWRHLRIVCTRLGTPAGDDGNGTNYRMQLSEVGAYLITGAEAGLQALRVDVTDRANVQIYVNDAVQPAPYLGVFPTGESVQVRFAARYAGEYGIVGIDGADFGDETQPAYVVQMDRDYTLLAHTEWTGPVNLACGKIPVEADNAMTGAADGTWGSNNLVDGERLSRAGKGGFTTAIYNGQRDLSANPHKLTIDLGTVKNVDRVYLYPRTDAQAAAGGYANYPENFTVQVSTDGTNYTAVKTVTGEPAPTETQGRGEYAFDAAPARYVRIVTTMLGLPAVGESATYNRLQLAEIEVYGKSDFTFDVVADRTARTVTVTGAGFEPGERALLRTGYNYAPAETDDYHTYVTADDAGRVELTLPDSATADLPWLGGHRYYASLGGVTRSAPIPAAVRAHSSARISLRIKGKAPLNLNVEALPEEAYTVTSSNPAVAAAERVGGGWVVTGKKAGTTLIVVRASDEFGGATHLVTVSVA